MALPHAGPGEPWDISPLGQALPQAQSSALFKSGQLEVMRLVLQAGKGLPPHKVAGEITIQCLEGEIEVQAQGMTRRLQPWQLMFLPGGEVHAVTAVQHASALVTVVLGAD